MCSRTLAIGILFLSQSMVGILGNTSLLSHYLIIYCKEHTLKPTDLILTHLTTANSLIMVSKGVPHTMAAFGMKQFFNGFICKLLLYIERLGRSMSMGSLCILSVYQAISISPISYCWKKLKVKPSNNIGLFISFCWVLYITLNFIFPVITHVTRSHKNKTEKRHVIYCSTMGGEKIVGSLYTALFVCPEVLISVLIIWSSGSMIAFLYRHKQHIQHIRSTRVYLRRSPESRATQSILILVSTFVAFYSLSSILQGFVAVLYEPGWWLVNITAIISMCFPTLGPLFVSRDFLVLRFCLFWISNVKIQ
ncbi:vomeronasal type-1 receptor 4-like [Meriones unguiculatus]|uniref:vomeronasal type-1 receptor 4-like n=1 Tax=Meriones unguiculatus TaxID=10047 RepID=UPI000B4F1750|nr:vomeronasal type-1 receptor 4-like [Meriones unguiculatus]